MSTTDKMLYMNTPIQMPLLSLNLPLTAFYIVMPLFVIALQFNLLYMMRQYKKKLLKINNKYPRDINSILFGLLEGAIFPKMPLDNIIRKIIVFLILVFPILVLFSFWFRFSDYQDFEITSLHFLLLYISILISGVMDPFFKTKTYTISKRNIIKLTTFIFSFIAFPLVVIFSLVHYQMYVLMPFFDKNTKYNQLEEIYNTYNIKILGMELLPRLVVTSELLIPLNNELLKALKDLDSSKNKRPLLLYSPPFNQENRNLKYSDFSNSIMIKTKFNNSDFTGSKFINTKLQCTDFSHTKLIKVNLGNADLRGSKLEYSHITNSYLAFANLQGTSSFKSNLSGSNLEYADIQGAYFDSSNFQRTCLIGTHFQGTFLANTSFQGAQSKLEKCEKNTKTDISQIDNDPINKNKVKHIIKDLSQFILDDEFLSDIETRLVKFIDKKPIDYIKEINITSFSKNKKIQ